MDRDVEGGDGDEKKEDVPRKVGSKSVYDSVVNRKDFDPFDFHPDVRDDLEISEGAKNWHVSIYNLVKKPFFMWLSRRDDDRSKWRKQLGDFLEWKWTEIFFAILLLLDIIVVVTEIIIADVACRSGHETSESIHHVEEGLHYTSVSILSILCLDLILTFIAHDIAMFKHFGYVLDAIIIPTALVLELLVSDIAGILVLLRLWRVIRIMHGAGEIMHKVEKDTAKKRMWKKIDEVENHYADELEHRDEEIRMLKEMLRLDPAFSSFSDTVKPAKLDEAKKEL